MRKILIAIFIRFSREVRANLVPSTLDVFATMVGVVLNLKKKIRYAGQI